MSLPQYLECVECGHQQSYQPGIPTRCEQCQSGWVEAFYDYKNFKRELLRGLPGRAFNIWRYHDVLPIQNPRSLDLETVGGTPMYLSRRFASELGHEQVYIKDERFGPTSSFKDRQAAVSVAAMVENWFERGRDCFDRERCCCLRCSLRTRRYQTLGFYDQPGGAREVA